MSQVYYYLLFYTYFYYWTAACIALLLAFLLDKENRRIFLYVLCIGVPTGLPVLFSGLLLKKAASPDWTIRNDLAIPISRFSELLIPKIALCLLTLMSVWVWKHRRDLIYVWTLSASAMLLQNHQIVTSLQMQNFHWTYVWGPCLTFMIVVGATDCLNRLSANRRMFIVGVVLVFYLMTGLWLRFTEATKTKESTEFTTAWNRYYEQQRSAHFNFVPNGIIAGDKNFVDFSIILINLRPLDHYSVIMSPWVGNAEWDSRVALNGFLLGEDRETFVKTSTESP